MNIVTTYDPPPIPMRGADWSAVDADTYDPDPDSAGNIRGYGKTEREAINNLVDLLMDAQDRSYQRSVERAEYLEER